MLDFDLYDCFFDKIDQYELNPSIK